MSEESKDLPLLSVESGFHVAHYVIQLHCDMENRHFSGSLYAFAIRSQQVKNKIDNHILILDLKDIVIESVKVISATEQEIRHFLSSTEDRKSLASCEQWIKKETKKELQYKVQEWSVEMELTEEEGKAVVVLIKYHTTIGGNSVSWLLDDNGQLCCLNTGSLINNRSLFPYQDTPNAMAMWQLMIRVDDPSLTVLTTGDEPTALSVGSQGWNYFFTSMLLPLSTFSLAIGHWNCLKQFNQCRLFSCGSFSNDLIQLLTNYIIKCLTAVQDLLGPLPVPKLDIIIVPKLVACLGFASPGLVLVSRSILYGRSPMLQRVAHEISHSWFGIVIGPVNWNEEWISEGFATFLEV